MSVMTSQITSLTIVYSSVYSDANQRKSVNSPHKRPVTRKMFPFDDVIMVLRSLLGNSDKGLPLNELYPFL